MRNLMVTLLAAAPLALGAQEIVSTSAYTWRGDTIVQGEYTAYAPNSHEIISDYSAQPHFFMPIEKKWTLKNDISAYPRLNSGNTLLDAVYNMGLDEMVNAVEPDTTLRTGKEWAGVWTRDVSYSIILSMAYLQPEASMISLRKKVNANGCIIQDTGSGGAWPISTDRMIWAVAAYEIYKFTGERDWIEFCYPVIKRSMNDDLQVVYTDYGITDADARIEHLPSPGVARGETSFIDWREQSYPKWMQCVDIYQSEAMGTNMVHAIALRVLQNMTTELSSMKGVKKAQKEEYLKEAKFYGDLADQLEKNINDLFWLSDKGYYGMYTYGRNYMIMNPRAETLGESLSILYDIAPADRQRTITENNPTTPFGAAIFYPQIADMPAYHNNALWPWVGAMWALANAKVGNELGTMQAIGAIVRPAALFCTNKENFNLDNGDIATELNSSNMLWCLSGNLALTNRILFGIHFELNGLEFHPFVPKAMAGTRSLDNFTYRDAKLNIKISGYGSEIKSFKLNGKEQEPVLPTNIKGVNEIEILMADNDIASMKVNEQPNRKAPLTPIAQLCNDPALDGAGVPVNNLLSWNPIEYIGHYLVLRDGKVVEKTRSTQFAATTPGEYAVIGVAEDGTPSFMSQPLSNMSELVYEMPSEGTAIASKEVSYQPKEKVTGYHGNGFVEIDHNSAPISIDVEIPEEAVYSLHLVYSNGNGPVNTENKCAIRTILVDGQKAGIVVMPHRGVANWNDWGNTNIVELRLPAGTHSITIAYLPENENMNLGTNHALIDRLILAKH
ncbi:MAG: hypothetical protein LIP09_12900 [Bacteroidales bacterium]|nr:hypothetical protein [Bacteroidales bacterium]